MSRVLSIVQSVYDADPRVRRKMEVLADAGCEVDVIALQPSSRRERIYSIGKIRVHAVPLAKKRASKMRYVFEYAWFFAQARRISARLARRHSYAMVDVNTLPDFLVYAAQPEKRRGTKVMLDMHEMMPEFYRSKFKCAADHWFIRLLTRIERAAFNYADHVLLIHDPVRELFERRGLNISKTTVIMNTVDPRHMQMPEVTQPRPKNCRFLVGYHGTLTSLYGVDIAVRGFAQAFPHIPDAHFWIIGDGPEREKLRELIETLGLRDAVHLLGTVPHHEVMQYIGSCDVGVLATRRDIYTDLSFSNKLAEYVLAEKPVISSRLMTTRRYFSEKALAYFEPENIEDLSARLRQLYAASDERGRMARRALEEYYPIRWDVMRERYLALVSPWLGNRDQGNGLV